MEWISVKDELPSEYTEKVVLVYYKHHQWPYDVHVGVGKVKKDDKHITHWMPLPEPPKNNP